jgi:hypothetical protein
MDKENGSGRGVLEVGQNLISQQLSDICVLPTTLERFGMMLYPSTSRIVMTRKVQKF